MGDVTLPSAHHLLGRLGKHCALTMVAGRACLRADQPTSGQHGGGPSFGDVVVVGAGGVHGCRACEIGQHDDQGDGLEIPGNQPLVLPPPNLGQLSRDDPADGLFGGGYVGLLDLCPGL